MARNCLGQEHGCLPPALPVDRACPAQVPAGCLPRTMEVILRNMLVESVRAGDKVVFVGDLVVVPEVAAISAPGERVMSTVAGGPLVRRSFAGHAAVVQVRWGQLRGHQLQGQGRAHRGRQLCAQGARDGHGGRSS